jgi:hypothetical protein
MPNFNFYNVIFVKSESSNQLVVKGEIENRSGRNYNAVAIRIVLFIKNIPIANTVTVVNGLSMGRTKDFEKMIEDLDFTQVGKDINRYEVYVESAY